MKAEISRLLLEKEEMKHDVKGSSIQIYYKKYYARNKLKNVEQAENYMKTKGKN